MLILNEIGIPHRNTNNYATLDLDVSLLTGHIPDNHGLWNCGVSTCIDLHLAGSAAKQSSFS